MKQQEKEKECAHIKQKRPAFADLFRFVRMEGLEPPRRETPDPKSGAATNYATCAFPFVKR